MIASLRLGGAERQLSGLALMLHARGHEVEVLTYREGDFFAGELREAGVKQTLIPHRRSTLSLAREITAHLRDTGCQILIAYHVGAGSKACLLKLMYPELRVIVSERNCITGKPLFTSLRLSMYRLADAVVSNSYAQEAVIRKRLPALSSRLSTIPNFVDSDRFKPSGKEFCQDSKIHVVTTARLNKRKNAVGLIRAIAVAGCDNLIVDWYGAQGEDSYFRRCMRLIGEFGLEDRFRIHPAVEDVSLVYSHADVFCLPSFYEGTPNALAEALASGLPAICSDVSDNARYVVPCVNGYLFNPKDVNDIAAILRKLASAGSDNLQRWGKESRRIAVEQLSKDVFVQRYEELIGGLCGGKNPIT